MASRVLELHFQIQMASGGLPFGKIVKTVALMPDLNAIALLL